MTQINNLLIIPIPVDAKDFVMVKLNGGNKYMPKIWGLEYRVWIELKPRIIPMQISAESYTVEIL